MTRTVNALVEIGFVQKSEHPTDGRQVVVSLTEAGEAEVRETRRRRDAWLAQQLSSFTPDERATLAQAAQLLRRIAAAD
jgi:DNA-binding MarR family transcriptional regulator